MIQGDKDVILKALLFGNYKPILVSKHKLFKSILKNYDKRRNKTTKVRRRN